MGKTRDVLKKITDTKRMFHEKMGTISVLQDRNGKNLTEAKSVKKRWQEYTEELYKKYRNDPDNHDGVIIHLNENLCQFCICAFFQDRSHSFYQILKASVT